MAPTRTSPQIKRARAGIRAEGPPRGANCAPSGGSERRFLASVGVHGITLLELMIVLVIIAIVSAVAIPIVNGSSNAEMRSAARQLASGLRLARSEAVSQRRETLERAMPGVMVMDTIYTPETTLLVKEARSRGCHVLTGVDMFIRQAALQFKLFTGREPPFEYMSRIVRKALSPVAIRMPALTDSETFASIARRAR